MEPDSANAPDGAQKMPRFDSPVRITVVSRRKRLCDTDGISAKAAIDGLVKAGILEDDSPKFVSEVRYRQEKSKDESTTLVIEAMEDTDAT